MKTNKVVGVAILMVVAQLMEWTTSAAEGEPIVIGPGVVLPAGTVIHTQEVYAVRGSEGVSFIVSAGQPLPPGVKASKACNSNGHDEAAAIAAGLITVTEDTVRTPAAGPTYNFQQSAPAQGPAVVINNTVSAPPAAVTKKCSGRGLKHFWHRCCCFVGVSVSASVSAGVNMAPPMRYPTYWEENTSYNEYRNIEDTRRLYSGYNYPDQVFSYGYAPAYYSSWTYVPTPNRYLDNSSWVRPFPAVRYINEAPRSQPSPHYQPYPSGGGHGGRGGHR